MKPIVSAALAAVAAVVLTSCDPQAFSLNVEMRYPSKSGIDLAGKSVAVVYLEDNAQSDSVFCKYMANGFASALEKDYFSGEEAIPIYKRSKYGSADYASKESLVNMVMETGEDIVFLFDSPEFGELSVGDMQAASDGLSAQYKVNVPVRIRLYAFDSMGKVDTVYTWAGSKTISDNLKTDFYTVPDNVPSLFWQSLSTPGEKFGKLSARIFSPQWKNQQLTVVYFDSPSQWQAASLAAYDFKWKEAMEIWMSLTDTRSMMKRSCAEYNIALACYMLGDKALALKWLDRSDEDYPISLSKNLRKLITASR